MSESPLSNNPAPLSTPTGGPEKLQTDLEKTPSGSPLHNPLGTISLVGAGPGDPGLLTLRGLEQLQKAEVVLYDGLVNPTLLEHAPPDAQRINVGKHGSSRIWQQPEIHEEMLRHLRLGKRVVRLKGGDPAVFARSAEELEFLAQHDIAAEIVPGITAALALPAYTGIPLTHRDHASAVALITGQQAENSDQLDWNALARFPGTLVFYMGVTTAASWSRQLLRAGKSPETPAAIIRRVSWPDQQIIRTNLGSVAQELTPASKLRPPVLVIVGQVALETENQPMVLQPPLFGCTVLITRAAKPNDPLATKLRSLGATILHQPTIEINPPMNYHDFDQAIANMNCFQWLIFTSSHAVEHFFKRLNELKLDARSIGSTKIACVGPGTAESLTAFHVHCDWIPKTYNAACLAETLPVDSSSKILWLRGSRTQDAMRDVFKQRGLELQEVIVYRSSDVQSLLPDVEASLARKPFDWMTITSPAIARSTATLLGNSFSKIPAAVLSHQVADEVIRLGGSVGAIASQATFDSLAEAIVRQEHERSKR